jgi:hypothetical protein
LPLLNDGHAAYQYRHFEKSFSTADLQWTRLEVGKLTDAIGAEFEKHRQAAQQKAKEAGMICIEVPIGIRGVGIYGKDD